MGSFFGRRGTGGTWGALMALGVALALTAVAGRSKADYILDFAPNPVDPFMRDTFFPNWDMAPTTQFVITECSDDLAVLGTGGCGDWCATSNITGLTIFNYGTAGSGDITDVYFNMNCGSKFTVGMQTMTFAGNWTVGVDTYPAWTWAGSIAVGSQICDLPSNGCTCGILMSVYTDISPCPTEWATIELGGGYNDITWEGAIRDSCGSAAPWGPISDPITKTIRYVMKTVDKDVVAPGDTLNYTIFYGLPGTGALTNIWVTDTMPSYTHLVLGSAVPVADPGYDPDPGPPMRLRWSSGAIAATTGGPTREIRFQATVDWGNLESFEPGSGDTAAVEGAFLFNAAHVSWTPVNGCSPGKNSNMVSSVVKRYMFWLIGDQDVLFAPKMGQPDDEIIYEIFVKNVSYTKTWWSVNIWDTVPNEIDSWSFGYGFYDPCTGWTMTPSGCAAASPDKYVTGAKATILKWVLDMPPAFTLSIQWKGKLKTVVTPGTTVLNRASIYTIGKMGVIDGSGSSQARRDFTQSAQVVLRTTFISYVGWASSDDASLGACDADPPTYFISFYPLNKAADFALYVKWACNGVLPICDAGTAQFAATGGVSPRIDRFVGTCTGGPPTDWEMGCKVERAPARYIPYQWRVASPGGVPTLPFNYLHKMVANSPIIWELSMCLSGTNQDANTYAGTTSLNFCGYIAYTFIRTRPDITPNYNVLDALHIFNTNPVGPTSVFMFRWNMTTSAWDFVQTVDLYNESLWGFANINKGHYRVISSAAALIVHKGYIGVNMGGAYNDWGTIAPNIQNGNLVNASLGTYYLVAGHTPGAEDVAIVGNIRNAAAGVSDATYDVYRYVPLDMSAKSPSPPNISPDMVGVAGMWNMVAPGETVPSCTVPGLPGANAHIYGEGYDNSVFLSRLRAYKVVQTGSYTPLEVYCGRNIVDRYSGGNMLHAARDSGGFIGSQVGTEFWLHGYAPAHPCGKGTDPQIETFDVFSPRVNVAVRCQSSDGYDAVYTTNDTDQCVSFKRVSSAAGGERRNWRITVVSSPPAINFGDCIGQWIACNIGEKFYTAPFLQRGVFYDILMPPTVFVGEEFWITVTVVETNYTVKDDYCGTTSFSATDPGAKIEGGPMDVYNYTWHSSKASCPGSPTDNGVRVFVKVSFSKLGMQTLVASDIADGSITGLATIMVVGVDVKLTKEPRFAIQASGDNVVFKICWSNFSDASAITFVVTDAVPRGTTYTPVAGTANLICGSASGPAPVVDVAYSTAPSTTPPATWSAGNPVTGTRWLRWTVKHVYVNSTGCLCFNVSVQ